MPNFQPIIDTCQFLLYSSPEAQATLAYLDSRLNREIQKVFGFGYFPDSNHLSLLTNSVEISLLEELKLVYDREIFDASAPHQFKVGFFDQHPLVMPFRDVYGHIVAMVGRSLLNDQDREILGIAKYKNTHFTKGNHLFGLYEAKKSILEQNLVYVVEGQFDVIKAVECGLKNVVALGNNNMTSYQFSLLCRYTDNIILLLDNDEAGDLGRSRAIKKYDELANLKANVFVPTGFKDLDEWLKVGSMKNLLEIIERAN